MSERAAGNPFGVAMVVILAAQLMVVLDFSIVNVALAVDPARCGVLAERSPMGRDRLRDRLRRPPDARRPRRRRAGRRRLFLAGPAAFSLASIVGGISRSAGMLLAARAAQGVGAAVIAPTALALIATTFAEGPARNRAIGMYGATASVGFVAGLVLGGVLVTSIGWRAVFWVNVPIGVAVVVLGWVSVPAAQHHGPAAAALAIGYGQALLFAAGLAAAAVVVSAGFMPASHAKRTCDPGTRLGLLPELEPHR